MAVTINASIDGVSYNGITKIMTGGKTVNLSGVADGSDLPVNVAEIVAGSYTQETDGTTAKTFNHGCAGAPDIIVMWSDFKTRYTSESTASNTTIVGAVYNAPASFKAFDVVTTGYSGNANPSNTIYGGNTDSILDGVITNVTDSTFDILFKSNRRLGGGLTYQWLAIRLA